MLVDAGVPASAAPFVLLSLFAGGPRELARYASGAGWQTDDRMSLEFSAARAMHAPPAGQAARLRALAATAVLPVEAADVMRHARADDWTALGDAALRAEAFDRAHDSYRRAVGLDSRSARALRGATEAAAGMQTVAEESEWLKRVAAADPANAAVRVELSHVTATLGDAETAVAAAREAVSLDRSNPAPLEQLASVFADLGDAARLASAADELVSRFPDRSDGRYYRAAALFLEGRPLDAEREAQALLGADPRHAKAINLLGVIRASRGDRQRAREAFMQSRAVNPRDPSVYVNLGKLSLEDGDKASAAEFFGEALTIDPTDQAAQQGLVDAR
jgi:tetratricopeptide (TPR) repeat protein